MASLGTGAVACRATARMQPPDLTVAARVALGTSARGVRTLGLGRPARHAHTVASGHFSQRGSPCGADERTEFHEGGTGPRGPVGNGRQQRLHRHEVGRGGGGSAIGPARVGSGDESPHVRVDDRMTAGRTRTWPPHGPCRHPRRAGRAAATGRPGPRRRGWPPGRRRRHAGAVLGVGSPGAPRPGWPHRAGQPAKRAGVGHRRSHSSKTGVTRATGVCWSMSSLTSTPQGVVPGRRHGRSRALASYQRIARSASVVAPIGLDPATTPGPRVGPAARLSHVGWRAPLP